MTKTLLQSIFLGAFCLCIALPAFAAEQSFASMDVSESRISRRMKSFSSGKKKKYTKVISKAKPQNFAKESKAYKLVLQEAVSLHNLMNSIQSHKRQLESFRLIVMDKEISEARIKDFDECNVKWLSGYFKEPQKVWDKLKDSADSRMTAYDLNMAVTTQQIAQKDVAMLTGIEDIDAILKEYDKEEPKMSESSGLMEDAPEIDIAFAVLNSFYPNQDDWGARKTSNTSSLPLWEDQKYLYNKDVWKPKYRKIVEFCEKEGHELVLKEPKIEDKVKYDYYFYNQVKSAHDAFVAQALAQGCILTPSMKEPPKVAPRPLPPVNEEIFVLNDEFGRLHSVYPQIPLNPSTQNKGGFEKGTLWEAYKEDGFNHISQKGEFNNYFEVSSNNTIMTRPTVDNLGGNRITKHFLYKRENQNALDAYNNMLDDVKNLKANVEEVARITGMDIPTDIDYLKEKDLDRLLEALKKAKNSDLKKAKVAIGNKNSTTEDNKKKAKKRLEGSKFGFTDASFESNMAQASALMKQNQGGLSSLSGKDVSLAEANASLGDSSLAIDKNMLETEKAMKQNQSNLGDVLNSRDEDWIYVNALEKDTEAELLITERSALIFDEALAEARANQELVNMLDQQTNEDKLKELENKNYQADINMACVKNTDKKLLDMNSIQIK